MNNYISASGSIKRTRHILLQHAVFLSVSVMLFLTLLSSCSAEAQWATDDVEVNMSIGTVSAAFIECDFSTNKDAYYLIACQKPWKDLNPMTNQKAFMQLALDSAYAEYLMWRNTLLRNKETNVAPFSSHSLQYGNMHHFFTKLMFDQDYWIYAFAVNPETMKPIGKLELIPVRTKLYSIVKDIRFEYRVNGYWDYIYPLDSTGNIITHFPYIATTIDSLDMRDSIPRMLFSDMITPISFFQTWVFDQSYLPAQNVNVRYGVQVHENLGFESDIAFEEGHTYYTAISGFDSEVNQIAIYKFRWTENYKHYFYDTDSTNIFRKYSGDEDDSWKE